MTNVVCIGRKIQWRKSYKAFLLLHSIIVHEITNVVILIYFFKSPLYVLTTAHNFYEEELRKIKFLICVDLAMQI